MSEFDEIAEVDAEARRDERSKAAKTIRRLRLANERMRAVIEALPRCCNCDASATWLGFYSKNGYCQDCRDNAGCGAEFTELPYRAALLAWKGAEHG